MILGLYRSREKPKPKLRKEQPPPGVDPAAWQAAQHFRVE